MAPTWAVPGLLNYFGGSRNNIETGKRSFSAECVRIRVPTGKDSDILFVSE